jgi:hypothetical protein
MQVARVTENNEVAEHVASFFKSRARINAAQEDAAVAECLRVSEKS